MKTQTLKLGLSALYYSGAARALAPVVGGTGAIFMLHHVRPARPAEFAPNRILEITPEFLEEAVCEVKRAGFEIVSLDEAHGRMTGELKARRPFACFTFDDGYRDNRDYAYPVLRRHAVPFTVYAASDFADGRGFLWWLVLEEIIARSRAVALPAELGGRTLQCGSPAQKTAVFDQLYWRLRTLPEPQSRRLIGDLAIAAGVDCLAPCRDLVMSWRELVEFAADPLVTIGAHSVSHHALAGLSAEAAHDEIAGSLARTARELQRPCQHFCYPYGSDDSASTREFEMATVLGVKTAVTTRKGLIRSEHGGQQTALPRVSINGDFQELHYFKTLLTGVPFLMWNALQ